MVKVQLINAPRSPTLTPGMRAGAYPPLNLVSLSSYLKQALQDVAVEVIDGEITPLHKILRCLDDSSELIGISANTLCYDTALEIASAAKDLGVRCVLGGPHAQFAAPAILANARPFDAVVVGDGEEALLRLVKGEPLEEIPNTAYRSGDRLVLPREIQLPLAMLPPLDFSDVPLEEYYRRYRDLYPEKPFKGALAVLSSKGCRWRSKTRGGCVFCSIQHLGFRIKASEAFWPEIERLHKLYGADFFWDVSDTFTMQPEWVRTVALERPEDLRIKFHLYARPSDITPAMASCLSTIGAYEVFLGLEGGSPDTLRAATKGTTREQNCRAVRLLNDQGIRVVVSLILGLPGETLTSLGRTLDMWATLHSSADISELVCSILMPLPGSGAFARMLELPELRLRYEGRDLFDLESLRSDWVRHFCGVTYDTLLRAQDELLASAPRSGSFAHARKRTNRTVSEGILGRSDDMRLKVVDRSCDLR